MVMQIDSPETLLVHHYFILGPHCHLFKITRLCSVASENKKRRVWAGLDWLFQLHLSLHCLLCSAGRLEPLTFHKLSKLFSANELNYLILYLR